MANDTSSKREDGEAAKLPPLSRQTWNLVHAIVEFVSDGLQTVTADQYRRRLAICDSCECRRNNRCLKCGCRLSLKARGRVFRCPLDKWLPE
jgi:hypothetical protein